VFHVVCIGLIVQNPPKLKQSARTSSAIHSPYLKVAWVLAITTIPHMTAEYLFLGLPLDNYSYCDPGATGAEFASV
jgi:hypothetical protein